jgi:hypothetical protein
MVDMVCDLRAATRNGSARGSRNARASFRKGRTEAHGHTFCTRQMNISSLQTLFIKKACRAEWGRTNYELKRFGIVELKGGERERKKEIDDLGKTILGDMDTANLQR